MIRISRYSIILYCVFTLFVQKVSRVRNTGVLVYAVFYIDLFQLLKENDVVKIPVVNNSPCIATVTLSATPSGGRYVNKLYVLTLIAP